AWGREATLPMSIAHDETDAFIRDLTSPAGWSGALGVRAVAACLRAAGHARGGNRPPDPAARCSFAGGHARPAHHGGGALGRRFAQTRTPLDRSGHRGAPRFLARRGDFLEGGR